jgi:hypothetical protein
VLNKRDHNIIYILIGCFAYIKWAPGQTQCGLVQKHVMQGTTGTIDNVALKATFYQLNYVLFCIGSCPLSESKEFQGI